MNPKAKKALLAATAVVAVGVAAVLLINKKAAQTQYTDTTYAMSTVITQAVYGKNAEKAMAQVNAALREYEDRLSLFSNTSEIAKINTGAGTPVAVSDETYALLSRALELSAQSDHAFDLTIAPLTLLWGVTGENPKVPPQGEIDALLPLVDDAAVKLDPINKTVQLAPGQGLDLGGIAKGNACSAAQKIYDEQGITSAVLNIGGNVYVKGTKPDGSLYRVGFRDPNGDESSYIASLAMKDQVLAVSGGYERYFVENGKKYCHIISGQTGWPVESDIVSVGIVTPDGTLADFLSTTLYVWGEQKSLAWAAAQDDVQILLLDNKGTLYATKGLEGSLELTEEAQKSYTIQYI